MNDRTYPLGVWDMYDEVKDLDRIEIINECFKKWWKYNEMQLLQQRIDKAIEYLKENACYENTISELFCDDLDTDSCMELLDILRGGNYESN